MEHFVTNLNNHFMIWLFLLMIVDTSGLPLPSEVPLLYGGYLVWTHRLSLVPAAFVSAAGALVGSLICYAISRKFGRALVLRYGRRVFITEEHVHRSERWFARRGDIAVFFCRMLPVARALISIPAGIAEMNLVRFSVYSFFGALPWAFGLLGLGYALRDRYKTVFRSFSTVSLAIAAVLVVLLFVWFVRKRRASKTSETFFHD